MTAEILPFPEISYDRDGRQYRRHLNESQRAMIAAKIAKAKAGERTDLVEISTRSPTAAEAAALLNVNRQTVMSARLVQRKGTPEDGAA